MSTLAQNKPRPLTLARIARSQFVKITDVRKQRNGRFAIDVSGLSDPECPDATFTVSAKRAAELGIHA